MVTPEIGTILQYGELIQIHYTFPVMLNESVSCHPVYILPYTPFIYVDYSSVIKQIAENTIGFTAMALLPDTITYVAVTSASAIIGTVTHKPVKYLDSFDSFPLLYRFRTRPGEAFFSF